VFCFIGMGELCNVEVFPLLIHCIKLCSMIMLHVPTGLPKQGNTFSFFIFLFKVNILILMDT